MSKKLKTIICIVCAAVIVIGTVLFFTLRKPSGDVGGGTNAQEIRIFTYSGHEFESVTMDSAMKKIEEKVDVKLAFEGATAGDYYTKLNPMISTGDWPDIIWSDPENSSGAFQNWADPKQDILYNLDELQDYIDKDIVIYCRSGHRSVTACNLLAMEGFSRLYNLEYGILEYF